MGVDYDAFLNWASSHFGMENLKFRGPEICANSPYASEVGKDDHKHHLWMRPDGGKKGLEGGAFRCWYTDRMGSLVSLVSDLDHIPFDEAEELICNTTSLRALEKRLHEFFDSKDEPEVHEPSDAEKELINLELPPFTFPIDGMSRTNRYRAAACTYLQGRKIPTDGMHVCIEGDYKNRIIIPYYDLYGKLIWYNARTMSSKKGVLRYMKPDDKRFNQEEVLYFRNWPRPGTKIYITEGEFDAISLDVIGLNGCACGGKFLSEAQIEMIRLYTPVLAFDADEGPHDTGRESMISIGNTLLEKGFEEIYYVRPPKQYKDWNKTLQEKDPKVIRAYIERCEKQFGSWTEDDLKAKRL